jgi:ribosome-binding factor A
MSKKKNHKKTLSELITEIYDSGDPEVSTQYTSLNQVQLAKDFADAKDLILELARALDESKQCAQRSQICRKIKEILRDKITEGKVTENGLKNAYHKNIKEGT